VLSFLFVTVAGVVASYSAYKDITIHVNILYTCVPVDNGLDSCNKNNYTLLHIGVLLVY